MLLEYKQIGRLVTVEPWLQLIMNLRNLSENPRELSGIYIDGDGKDYLAQFNLIQNRRVELSAHNARVVLYYLLGEHQAAETDRMKFTKYEQEPGTIFLNFINASFYALNAFALAAQKGHKHAPTARKYVKVVRKYGQIEGPDIQDMLRLLTAEELALSTRNISQAQELYNKAIEGFAKGQMFLMEAIAYERLGLALERPNDDMSSQEALRVPVMLATRHLETSSMKELRQQRPQLE